MLWALGFGLWTLYSRACALCSVFVLWVCTLCSVLCTLCSELWAVICFVSLYFGSDSEFCALGSVLCALCSGSVLNALFTSSGQCALCSVLWIWAQALCSMLCSLTL